ncbi:tripartite tricarboxylate transporter substrate binding protein [Diaphorobacter sp. HDW4A]|uniref:Bug family tripartite tricarboxylate transporter substrate binding protein n=1 Tax=Diaphorobacter sp. HDW4A TaxID=2714924 RepID=UPI001F10AE47|nr:tripartite tricarboxylate transporter substrate-binding protein [Diaphorobacter sp. HDW4A]
MDRRRWLLGGVALACTGLAPLRWAHANTNTGPHLGEKLHIVIPANPGGGWDQTGRALGAALVDSGVVGRVSYENIGGKGGTIGLARYVEQYAAASDTLLIGGMVMVGAIALQKPPVDMRQIRPLARLTSDYLVVAVAADSPIRDAKGLMQAMRSDMQSLTVAGGSAGGVDHMFAGMLARAAKVPPDQLQYKPFPGGNDVVDSVLSKQSQVAISGFSEMSEALSSGRLHALGVSARKRIYGLPSFKDMGVDAAMANWRAVFTGNEVPDERCRQLLVAIEYATARESWKRSLQANRWDPSWQSGKDFTEFLTMENTTAQVMNYLLKLKG